MDLTTLIHSENADKIQLVVSAKDLRELLDRAMQFAIQQQQERDEPKYYTREELRDDVLHCSDPTLRNYRKKGIIPEPITIGGRVLYDKAEVRKAMSNLKNKKYFKLSVL